MAKFLVTGGAGFIGSNLADWLASDESHQVTVVDNVSTGFERYVAKNPKIKFIKADANKHNEIKAIFENGNFDYVYHYAAVVGVGRTLKHPIKVLEDIEGIKNVLELSHETGVRRVLYSSSSEVYGEPVELPQHEETTPLNSRLPYAVVKNIGESYLRSYKQEKKLDYTIFRFFNTFGPRQSSDFVISKFLDAALKGNDITIYGDGGQTRTFCYIDDNVEATINAIRDESMIDEVVNIGNDKEVTIKELADIIIKVTGSSSKIVHLPPLKEGDMTRRQPDITKMKRLLKRDMRPLEDGLKKLITYKKSEHEAL